MDIRVIRDFDQLNLKEGQIFRNVEETETSYVINTEKYTAYIFKHRFEVI